MCNWSRVHSGFASLVLCVSTVSVPAQHGSRMGPDRQVSLLTWNTYLGGDIEQALDPSLSQEELLQAIAQIWAEVQLTNFPERAHAIAVQIALTQPKIVCLQEAALWRTGDFLSPEPAATVVYDFVSLVLDALNSRGLHYEVVAVAQGFNAEIPNIATLEDLRYTDRQAILVRSDLRTSDLKWSNVQIGTYDARIPLELLGQELSITRTWISLDVKVRGKSFRLISTHLESFHPLVQVAQALELLYGPSNTERPVILVGDLNSPVDGSGTPTYDLLLQAGFEDTWAQIGVGSGFTCCQEVDLRNPVSTLYERIDLILHRGEFSPEFIDVLGEEQMDRTATGMWPSDHAGVVTELHFGKSE